MGEVEDEQCGQRGRGQHGIEFLVHHHPCVDAGILLPGELPGQGVGQVDAASRPGTSRGGCRRGGSDSRPCSADVDGLDRP